MEEPLQSVPETATHWRSNPRRWTWVEPSVWTERMLTALEQGVKGDCWFSLIFRWPNRYFAEQGLFRPVAAHAEVVQPSPR
jgi:hypothetical protein